MNSYIRADIDRWNLYFDVDRSLRYHRKRQGFFELMQLVLTLVSASAGSAAFLALKDLLPQAWAQYLVITAALFSVLSLVIRPSERAQQHAALFDKFTDLQKEVGAAKTLPEAALGALQCKRLDIEKAERNHSRALNAVCYDETARALAVPAGHATRTQRLFGHFLP